jgi:hypothetical protein
MDNRPYKADLKPLGRTFPHSLGGDTKYFYLLLTLTPMGDILTLEFAKALVENEKLDIRDMLSRFLSLKNLDVI